MKKTQERGLTPFQAMFPIIGSIMGAGVLNLPQSVEKSGYLLSGPILLCVAAMSGFTLYQLVFCAKQLNTKSLSYFEVCNNAFPALGYAAEACIGAQGLGVCFVYFLILKDWISKFLNIEQNVKDSLLTNLLFSAAVLVIPAVLAAQKDLRKLGFASILCTISVLYLSVVVLSCGLISVLAPAPAGVAKHSDLHATTSSPVSLFKAAFEYIFAIGCQQNMVRVYSLLERKTVAGGLKAGLGAVAVAALVFFLVSNGGYLAGGNGQTASILDVLEDQSRPFYAIAVNLLGTKFFHLITLAKLGMIIVLFAGYPLQMHPTRDSILTFAKLGAKPYIERNLRQVEIMTTTVVSLLIFLGSLTKVNYSYVMKIIAATASCYIMYLLPSLAYLYSSKKTKLFTAISSGILLLSLTISGIGIYSAIADVPK